MGKYVYSTLYNGCNYLSMCLWCLSIVSSWLSMTLWSWSIEAGLLCFCMRACWVISKYWYGGVVVANYISTRRLTGYLIWQNIIRNGELSVFKIAESKMTSPNGNIFRVTGPLWRESTSDRFFFYLRQNKRLSKQSRRRWVEGPSRSLWRHCYE